MYLMQVTAASWACIKALSRIVLTIPATAPLILCWGNPILLRPVAATETRVSNNGLIVLPHPPPLCVVKSEDTLSVIENAAGSSMSVDRSGALYVTDYENHRVLDCSDPFATGGTAANDVWGQADFTGNACNRGQSGADATTLCFIRSNEELGIIVGTAGVDTYSSPIGRGSPDVWVADSGNNRVLRFPQRFSYSQSSIRTAILHLHIGGWRPHWTKQS